MNHTEKRKYLIKRLLDENSEYRGTEIPEEEGEQKRLLRGLMNVRMPGAADEEFLAVQDEYLQEALEERGVVDINTLEPVEEGIYLWQGDITRLNADAITNAANVAYGKMIQCYGTEYVQNPLNTGTLSGLPFHALAA